MEEAVSAFQTVFEAEKLNGGLQEKQPLGRKRKTRQQVKPGTWYG